MVDMMVEVLTCIDKPSSVEQVIAVPTVDFRHRVFLRTVPRETQTVEQLVDVPMPQTALLALAEPVYAALVLARGVGMDSPARGRRCKYWARLKPRRTSGSWLWSPCDRAG